jgi:hypothetical protein
VRYPSYACAKKMPTLKKAITAMAAVTAIPLGLQSHELRISGILGRLS